MNKKARYMEGGRQLENPPELDIDRKLGAPHERGRLERRIVWNLLRHLRAHGFRAEFVADGETRTAVSTARQAMELIFNLDEAWVLLGPQQRGHYAWVALVLGNGTDVVSDWSLRSGFSEAMDAFNGEDFA